MKNYNKKAEVAMGTLIIFIAMILIAAVAAAVLISSIGSIQSKALETGSATRQEIGTNVNVVEIYGPKDTNESTITNISMVVRLAAGSDPIRLSDLLLTIGAENFTNEFTYNSTDHNKGGTAGASFNVSYLLEGNNNQPDYLVKGDVARFDLELEYAVGEDASLRFTLIPKIGTPAIVFATTPNAIANSRETIFP
ncbi:MAG: archaellin/type IV pilin N-terminal domain-containing protein [Candidatus Woesearchaeota archaeon]